LRYTNVNPTTSVEENSKYVIMPENMIDENGYAVLLPLSRERGTMVMNGMPNVIHHWGRVCQLISPMVGSLRTSILPMVGCASDSQIYAQFEWTYQVGYERRTVRKVGKMELERLPWIKNVEVVKNGGGAAGGVEEKTGYVWEGSLEVTIEKCEEFDAFVAQTSPSHRKSLSTGDNQNNKTHPLATVNANTSPKTAIGDVTKNTTNPNVNESNGNTATQIYHVEMVIESLEFKKLGEVEVGHDFENQNENETNKGTNKTQSED